MFKKLKEKIAEEVSATPQKFQQLAQVCTHVYTILTYFFVEKKN